MYLLQLFRLSLADVSWKRVAGIGAIAAVILLVWYTYLQGVALRRAEVAYAHPATTESHHHEKTTGPVIIKTRVVVVPGRTETIREEVRMPTFETWDFTKTSTPVFPPAPRADRYLVGGFALQGGPRMGGREYGVQVGYSFSNRLDLYLGGTRAHAILGFMCRF